MKYLLYAFGYEATNNYIYDCLDEEDLAEHATSAILNEKIERVEAEKIEVD